jgi:hypothetical protein
MPDGVREKNYSAGLINEFQTAIKTEIMLWGNDV